MSALEAIAAKAAASWIGKAWRHAGCRSRIERAVNAEKIAWAEREQKLRENLLAEREAAAALRREKAEAEARLADRARLDDRLRGLAMATLATGTHVYVERGGEEGSGDSPPPYYCALCFERRRVSPLQPTSNRLEHRCMDCQATYQIVKPEPARPLSIPSSRRGPLL